MSKIDDSRLMFDPKNCFFDHLKILLENFFVGGQKHAALDVQQNL
jgi:hypothetical protein